MSPSFGEVGLRETDAIVGAVFTTLTADEVTAVPVAEPSFGVAIQATESPLLKEEPVRVLAVAPETVVPFTVHA